MTRSVHFSDTDMAGVMHFANYFRIMEETEHAFWRAQGMSVHTQQENRTISWPRVAATCEFFIPVRFEDQITIRLEVVKLTEKSVHYGVEFVHADQRVARGRMTAVCCEVADSSFKAITIPESMRSRLNTLMAQISDPA